MFEHSEKRLGDRLKFGAQIHGVKFDEKVAPAKEVKSPDKFMFGDPEAYKDMTAEQREALTKKMMNRHKIWVQETKPLGGKTARMG